MKHTFTTEQMKKFFVAVGCPNVNIRANSFSTFILKRLVQRNNGLKSFPKLTDDPIVNHAVECVTAEGNEPPYDEKLNLREIQSAKARGLSLVS